MGRVPEPHASPKAPEDRAWDWHGTEQADKSNAIIESGGWELLANAHAWFDPSQDEEGHDPPHEKGAYKLPHHEIEDERLRVVWNGVRSAMQVLLGARGGVDFPRATERTCISTSRSTTRSSTRNRPRSTERRRDPPRGLVLCAVACMGRGSPRSSSSVSSRRPARAAARNHRRPVPHERRPGCRRPPS